ncbi:hypothetical protein AQJ27_32945 [Streptomyces olivochromogenes]|nr:hypothetical protein AQJ27_32945 [Streptomyces olivochromogenes]
MFLTGVAGCLAVISISLAIFDAKSNRQDSKQQVEPIDLTPIAWTITAVLIAAIIVGVFYLMTRREYMKNQNQGFDAKLQAQKEYHRQALEKLRKATELNTLMELNQGQIGAYHKIVTEQADKSFKSSRTAMGVGLLLLVCAAFGGAYVPLEQVRWFIGALAAFSTMLSGYLTKTYLAMYKESIGQLNRYFDQPVLNSYYLTAERLAEVLKDEQAVEVRRQIISHVLKTSSRMGGTPNEPRSKGGKLKPKKPRPPKQRSSSSEQV